MRGQLVVGRTRIASVRPLRFCWYLSLVGGDEGVEGGLLGGGEQVAVLQLIPAHLPRGRYLAAGQVAAERGGRALIEEQFHE